MDKKEDYREHLEAQLKALSAQLEALKAKAGQAAADLKVKYHEQIEALRPQQEAAWQKLQELTAASAATWQKLKPEMEKAWQELRNAVESVREKFK
jgi:hypothetical protein